MLFINPYSTCMITKIPFVDLHFSHASLLDSETRFLSENWFFFKIGVATYFYLFLKRENKIRDKTLKKMTLDFQKNVFENPTLNLEVR